MSDFLAAENKLKTLLPKILSGSTLFDSSCKRNLSSFAVDLISGILRHFNLINFLIDNSLKKNLSHQDTRTILTIGLYRIYFQQNDNHAIIKSCMRLCDKWKLHYRRGLVYAVLQKHSKSPITINDLPLSTRFSCPEWFIDEIKLTFPNDYLDILHAQEKRPKAWVNWLSEKLLSDELTIPHPDLPKTAQFNDEKNLEKKIGYEDGLWQIQDLSSQLMVDKIIAKPQRILDACAAPGGKAIHLAKKFPRSHLWAVEINERRFKTLLENTQRIACENLTAVNDDCVSWASSQKPFDLIWLDAPCSGTGVLKKHPDIKRTITQEKIEKLQETQLKLLNNLWPFLEQDGLLVYSTCSILGRENDDVIATFISQHNLQVLPVESDRFSIASQYGRYYPISSYHGGYIAILKK